MYPLNSVFTLDGGSAVRSKYSQQKVDLRVVGRFTERVFSVSYIAMYVP